MTHKKTTSYRLHPYTLDQLERLAVKSGMSKTQVLEMAIDRLYVQELAGLENCNV